MKLTRVHITEFQSIRDSTSFDVGGTTCLVGKNESGKTTVLQALYRLDPIVPADGVYDVTDDYPRADVEDYRLALDDKKREAATVVRATFRLDESEMEPIIRELGPSAFTTAEITLLKGYAHAAGKYSFTMTVQEEAGVRHLLTEAGIHPDVEAQLTDVKKAADAVTILKAAEQTEAIRTVLATLEKIANRGMAGYIFDKYVVSHVPKFVYFDDYYQMEGFENIEQLRVRQQNKTLKKSDYPMLGLIELARLKLDDLVNPQRTQELVNKLEGAGNYLSKRVLKYWSQNKHLAMRFDVRPARPADPEGMRSGTNIWAGVYDSRHKVTTNLGSRSQGFVWFFSFLAWYSQLQRENKPLILLLDEPGLFLHAKAQMDLLSYFESELGPHHQLVYTTHSPFMVDPTHWERVRIVQDKGIDTLDPLPPNEEGTKVLDDVLEASNDSLFPLQAALGYEIQQTLFVGPNSLIVEGPSDLLYIQAMSAILEREGREGLSRTWTITPVGGAEKVPTFVALIGAQGLNVATLIDIDKENEQTIQNLYKKKLLVKKRVLTYADFTGLKYADAEDMFDMEFYLELVNAEFKDSLGAPIASEDLRSQHPRVLRRLEDYFGEHPLNNAAQFNHYRPARYFVENSGALRERISDRTLDRFEEAFKRLNELIQKG